MLRVIDTETCDLQGGIVEVASVDVIDGKIVNPMSHLVRPTARLARKRWPFIALLNRWWRINPGLKRSFRTITAARGMSRTTPALTAGTARDARRMDLHHEAGASTVAGDQIQQYGAVYIA